jgi:hypothetical protein
VCEEVFLLLIRKMTDTKIEQRTNIKFLAKLKKTTTETYQLLYEVYEDTLLLARVFEWHRRFLGDLCFVSVISLGSVSRQTGTCYIFLVV